MFDRLNQKVVGIIDVESEQPFAFHEEVQSALENLAKEILKLWYYAEQFTSTLSSRVPGKVAVTGQTAFRETTLVALSRLGLDAMIS